MFVSVFVLFCITLGLTIALLPWTGAWFESGLVERWPGLQHLLHLGFVRGAVSGLGLIDIWLGVLEVIHYHDHPPALSKGSHEQQQQ